MSLKRTWGLTRSLAMYYGQPWKRSRMRALYAEFIGPGELAFDIGSHLGNRTGCWLGLGARVVAVEPQPDCLAVLERLYGGHDDVTLLPVGVASAPGALTLHISTATPTVSSFSADWIDEVTQDPRFAGVSWDERIEVEVTTLDALIATHGVPAFCKIDVEGLEEDVLAGLSHPVRGVSFEYIPAARERAVQCIERLEGLGNYRYRTSPGETLRLGEVLDAGAMKRWLATLSPDAASGDVYAQR